MQPVKDYFLHFKSHFFDISIFSILIIVMSSCFMTYRYPHGQTELYYLGGQPLWATQYGGIIIFFFIIVPSALIISYFFQTKINIWKPARFFVLAGILCVNILFLLKAIADAMFAVGGLVVCMPASMILPLQNGSISKTMDACMNATGISTRIEYGAAVDFLFIAGGISIVTLSTLLLVQIITSVRKRKTLNKIN